MNCTIGPAKNSNQTLVNVLVFTVAIVAVAAKQAVSQKNKKTASVFKAGQKRVATMAVARTAKNQLAAQHYRTGAHKTRT